MTRLVFERVLLLKRVPWFELLRTDQLRQLAALLEPAGWAAGETIFRRGEPGAHMYIVVSGRIGISLDEGAKHPDFIATIEAGECFGEMGLLDDLPRSASAVSIVDSEALALEKEKLRGLLLAYPELGLSMLRALSRRLRACNQVLSPEPAHRR